MRGQEHQRQIQGLFNKLMQALPLKDYGPVSMTSFSLLSNQHFSRHV